MNTRNTNEQVETLIRATGATAVSYDLLGITLTLSGGTSVFIDYAAGQAIDMLRYEVERGVIDKARAEARASKAVP